MITGKKTALFGALAAFVVCAQAATPEGWTSDFENAKAEAQASKKDLFLDFTGSDWCTGCMRLRKEVFEVPAFKEAAPKDFVLVELDSPEDEKRISSEIRKQNNELIARYGVERFPTVFLADALGRPYAITGYKSGGAEQYVEHLKGLRQIRLRRDEAFAKAEALKGVARAKALKEGLDVLQEATVAAHYRDVLKDIETLDPEDTLGMSRRFGFPSQLLELDRKYSQIAAPDGAKVRAVAEEFLKENPKLNSGQKQQVLVGILKTFVPPRDNQVALEVLEQIRALDPRSDLGTKAEANRQRLLKVMESSKGTQN